MSRKQGIAKKETGTWHCQWQWKNPCAAKVLYTPGNVAIERAGTCQKVYED